MANVNIKKHLNKLGYKAKDKVTGFEGVITSVSFDLFGCVQALVDPGMDKDGKRKEQAFMDIARLEILGKAPVMEQPDFDWTETDEAKAAGKHGPARSSAVPKRF